MLSEIFCRIYSIFICIVYFHFLYFKIVLESKKGKFYQTLRTMTYIHQINTRTGTMTKSIDTGRVAENDMEFGKLLAQLRKEKGLLQKEVATHLNMTVATVSNYEKGVHLPDLHTLILLADFYDVSTDYLLQRTDCRTSIDTLNHQLSADYTVGDMMNTVMELDDHNTQALLDYYDLLLLRNSIKRVK